MRVIESPAATISVLRFLLDRPDVVAAVKRLSAGCPKKTYTLTRDESRAVTIFAIVVESDSGLGHFPARRGGPTQG